MMANDTTAEQLASREDVGRTAHVPPSLGSNVDEVMLGFKAEDAQWCGLGHVTATLIMSDKGPAIQYRWGSSGMTGRKLGVILEGGWLIRDASPSEEDELELGLRKGWVQIESWNRIERKTRVLHQATGREML